MKSSVQVFASQFSSGDVPTETLKAVVQSFIVRS